MGSPNLNCLGAVGTMVAKQLHPIAARQLLEAPQKKGMSVHDPPIGVLKFVPFILLVQT